MFISDNSLQSLARLNITCQSVREETSASLWGKATFGGKYEWAERFGLEAGYRGEGKAFVRMKKYVR